MTLSSLAHWIGAHQVILIVVVDVVTWVMLSWGFAALWHRQHTITTTGQITAMVFVSTVVALACIVIGTMLAVLVHDYWIQFWRCGFLGTCG